MIDTKGLGCPFYTKYSTTVRVTVRVSAFLGHGLLTNFSQASKNVNIIFGREAGQMHEGAEFREALINEPVIIKSIEAR